MRRTFIVSVEKPRHAGCVGRREVMETNFLLGQPALGCVFESAVGATLREAYTARATYRIAATRLTPTPTE